MDSPKSILVADDQAGQRSVLDMLLTLDGYEVVTVEDGREALAYLKDHTPSLVILDIHMPFMTGIDICDRMRRVPRLREIPVILLTAAQDEKTLAEARLAGADLVFPKPLQGKDFRGTVRELLEAEADSDAV